MHGSSLFLTFKCRGKHDESEHEMGPGVKETQRDSLGQECLLKCPGLKPRARIAPVGGFRLFPPPLQDLPWTPRR